jgi:hypothetical protein
MRSLFARRLFGLAAGTLALLVLTERADAAPKTAPKKDAEEAAEAKSDAKSDKKKKTDDDADDKDADAKSDKKKKGDADADADAKDADDKDEKDDAKKKEKVVETGGYEAEGKDYYFVGLRYRHTILPKFLINLFVDGGPTVVSLPGFGLEASKRRDGFEMIGALTFQNWGMDPFPFKGKNESDYAYEIVESHIKMLNATADFLWSSKLSGQELQFQYGLTAGVGFVWGDLIHQQARPAGGGDSPGDPNTYVPCKGPGDAGSNSYCNPNDNSRWTGYKEPSWAGGGYKPIIFPTFGLQLGLRWKPAKQFVGRLDVGYNLFSGFFFGLGADYGI